MNNEKKIVIKYSCNILNQFKDLAENCKFQPNFIGNNVFKNLSTSAHKAYELEIWLRVGKILFNFCLTSLIAPTILKLQNSL